ncbi:MAG: SDR family oxidoreductase [Candidatus Thermoplasmatota archaeon]|nr:SDR family oxidoreductase [Candidatus Thermoplasmatota archaeon]
MGILEDYFKGKTFIIAGVGPGQGLSTARLLKKFGATVYGLSRSGVFPSEKLDKEIRIEKCDLEDTSEIRKTLEGIIKETGAINGSVNNVGTWEPAENKVVKPDTLMKFFKLNVMTQYNLIYILKDVMNSGSSMVNIGASRHLFGANHSGYTISKYAIEEMTRITASGLKKSGIRVNSILPGSVGKEDNFGDIFPFNFNDGRTMDPLKIAYVSAFLLSPLSAGINGESLTIDDGMGL